MKWLKHTIILLLIILVWRDVSSIVSSIYKSCLEAYEKDSRWHDIIQELKKYNPKWNGQYRLIRASNQVIGLDLSCKAEKSNLSDLHVLKGLPFKELILRHCDIKELGFVKGMPLEFLDISYTYVDSLEQLETVPLKELFAKNTQINDITPLKNKKLIGLWLSGTGVDDLTPLVGMHLDYLIIDNTPAATKIIPRGIMVKDLKK